MNKQEMIDRIKVLSGMGTLEDDEVKELDKLNNDLSAIKAKETAVKLMAEESADEKARIEREKAEAVAEAVKAEQARNRRLQYNEAPYAAKFSDTNKFDELTAGETALVIETLNAQGKPVSGAAYKALTLKIGELKDKSNTEDGLKSINYVKNAFKAHTNIEPTPEGTSQAVKAATDPMYTGGSLIGSDWVGTAYASQIWEAIRAANVVFDKVPSQVVPDGYSSIYIPLESSDPTWYKIVEAVASDSTLKVPAATVPASQMATANKQLTLGKLGARSLYTGELTEDSLIPFAPQLRAQLTKSGNEILEHVMIDGDVETSNAKNINAIDTTPAGSEPYLLLDGFRKLALITNTANSRSASGAFVIEDFKNTLKLMGTAGLAGSDPNAVAFLVDYNVMWALMDLPELKTKDVSSYATIENGFVTRVYRTQVLNAFQMHRGSAKRMANNAGKIDADTDSNNTLGAILAVRFDQWKQAFKRRMTIETTRIANADSWEIVAILRWGMAYRDSEASAITYNVGV